MANSICERVIGTIRRECLDWLIPISEKHLRLMIQEWTSHYNRGRLHMSLGPGVPDPPISPALTPREDPRHRLGERFEVRAKSIWVACIMSTRWRPSVEDDIYADHTTLATEVERFASTHSIPDA